MPDRHSNTNPQQQAELLRSAAAHREGATQGSEALSKWNDPENFRDGTETCHEARENYYDGQGHRRPGRSGGGGYDQAREGLELRVGEERAQWLSENHARRGNLASGDYAMVSGGGRRRRGGLRDSVPRSGPDYSRGGQPPTPMRSSNANRASSPRASGTVRFGRDGARVGQGGIVANSPPVGPAAPRVQTSFAGTRRRVAAEAPAITTTRTTATANPVNTPVNTRRAPDVPLSAIMGGPTHAQRQEAARGAMPRPTNSTSKLSESDHKDRGRSAAPRDQTPADDSRASSILPSKPLGHMEDIDTRRFKLQAMAYIQVSPTYGANFYLEHPQRQQYYDAVRKNMVAEATGHAANPASQEAKDCYDGEKKKWMLEAAVQAREMVREHTETAAEKFYRDNPNYADFYAVAKQELKKENRKSGKSASTTAEVATSLRDFSITPGPHNTSASTKVNTEPTAKAVQQGNGGFDNTSPATGLVTPSSPAKRTASTTIARAPAATESTALNVNKKSKRVKMVYDDGDSKTNDSPVPIAPAPNNGVSKFAPSAASAPKATNESKASFMKSENSYEARLAAAQITAPAENKTVNDLISGPFIPGEEDYITKARAKRAENRQSMRENKRYGLVSKPPVRPFGPPVRRPSLELYNANNKVNRASDKWTTLTNAAKAVKTEPAADFRKQTSSASSPFAYAGGAGRPTTKARENGNRRSVTGPGFYSRYEPEGLQGTARLSEASARKEAGLDDESEPEPASPKSVKRERELSGLFSATTPAPAPVAVPVPAPVPAAPVPAAPATLFIAPAVKTEVAPVAKTNGASSVTGTSVNGTSAKSGSKKPGKLNLKLISATGDESGETKAALSAKITLEGILRATDSDVSPLALTIMAQMLTKKLPKIAKDAVAQAAMLQGGEEDSDEEL